jgi:hypothetical protein
MIEEEERFVHRAGRDSWGHGPMIAEHIYFRLWKMWSAWRLFFQQKSSGGKRVSDT